MRYTSTSDAQLLRGRALSPVIALQRRNLNMPVPGRGLQGLQHRAGSRVALRGFGATSYSAPIGAGAGAGAETGAAQGASIGGVFGPIGAAIGAVIGAAGGAIAGSFGKKDPEVDTLGAALTGWRNSGQNPTWLYQLANKYLILAGLMDLTPSQIAPSSFPVYLKYGRMGEINFARDLVNLLYAAGQSGQIGPNDTPGTVWNNIVLPWMDSWGKGRNVDRGGNGSFVDSLEQGLMMDYLFGQWKSWASRTGSQAEMQNWPMFALATPPTTSPTPSPVAVPAQPTVAPSVPTTLSTPLIDQPLSQAPDSVTGAITNLPSGAIYAGKSATGAWIITYAGANAGFYTLVNGVLTPYSAPSTSNTQPVAASAGAQSVSTAAPTISSNNYTALTPSVSTTATVSTTPPAIGAAITALRDNSTGAMVNIPSGGAYAGLTSTNGWLVTYPVGGSNPAGTYESNNGLLTLYTGVSSTPGAVPVASPPAGYTATGQSVLLNGTSYPLYADGQGNQYVWTGVTMVPYQSALNTGASATSGGGGGGGYYPSSLPGGTPQGDLTQNAASLSPPAAGLDSNTLLLIGAAALGLMLLSEKRA